MALKFSDREQTNFIMAVDHIRATASRLHDVTGSNDWDGKLDKAWTDFIHAVSDATVARSWLS